MRARSMTRRAATPRETSSSSARAPRASKAAAMSSERVCARAPLASSTTARSARAGAQPDGQVLVVDVGADDQQRDGIRERTAVGLLLLEADRVVAEDVERTEGLPVPGEGQRLHRPVAGGHDGRAGLRPARRRGRRRRPRAPPRRCAARRGRAPRRPGPGASRGRGRGARWPPAPRAGRRRRRARRPRARAGRW